MEKYIVFVQSFQFFRFFQFFWFWLLKKKKTPKKKTEKKLKTPKKLKKPKKLYFSIEYICLPNTVFSVVSVFFSFFNFLMAKTKTTEKKLETPYLAGRYILWKNIVFSFFWFSLVKILKKTYLAGRYNIIWKNIVFSVFSVVFRVFQFFFSCSNCFGFGY